MKWNLKPVSMLKQLAAGVSVVTMCISPLAEGAAAASQKKLINQYLKETGLTTRKMTVGEYWRMVRHVYPPKLQLQMDEWVRLNRLEVMPNIEATSFKDADGKEQVRLTLTKDGQSATLTFTGDEDKPLKVNGVSFSRKELLNYNSFNDLAAKMAKQDATVGKALKTGKLKPVSKVSVLTWNEYKKLTVRQRAEYMVRMRAAMEAAAKVLEVRQKYSANEPENKYEFVLQTLFGDYAFAGRLTGQNCIIAGYISKYGKDDSCGSERKGGPLNADLRGQMEARRGSCSGNQVACNPLVYGFKNDGGSFCVPQSNVKYATDYCNKQSPVATPQDKKRIIESYLKHAQGQNVDLKLNEEGKIPEDQKKDVDPFLSELRDMLNEANQKCETAPLKDIKQAREEQDDACRKLQTRMIALETFAVNPQPPAPPAELPEPPTQTCNDETPGAVPTGSGDKQSCTCPEGQKKGEGGICLIVETGNNGDLPGGKEPKKEDSCGFWCKNKNWIIPVGIGALALGLFWWLTKKDSKAKNTDPVYVPPAPVPEPTATTSPTTPIVEPPPVAPCPAPNTVVNGVCTPPVITPPPVPTTEGGTTPDVSGRAGGVR